MKFHDGSEFTADDVVFSLGRPETIKNSPGPYTVYTKAITEKIVVDKHTLRLKTATPYPLVPNEVGAVMIVSKRAAPNATTDDFNTGKAAIGTGPYKFVRWAKGDRIELVRNDAYWGPKPPWERVDLPADHERSRRASRRSSPATCRRSRRCRPPTSPSSRRTRNSSSSVRSRTG